MDQKSVYTTGEISKLIHIHQTTVIDWVDKGLMTSYKTPGGHRRISKDSLLTFLDNHNMPVPHLLIKAASNPSENEAHRHLHEGFQVGPQAKPMEAYPPLPKQGGVRNTGRKLKLAQKK